MDRKQESREIMRGETMAAEMSAVGVGRSWGPASSPFCKKTCRFR